MKTIEQNKHGYEESAITNMDGFRQTKFLLASGTGDDNVHFHNAAKLVYELTGARIPADQYRVQYYTDGDHSLFENGAHTSVMKMIKEFLCEKFRVKCID